MTVSVHSLPVSMQDSLVYEDLVSHIPTVEKQITGLEKTIAQQWKTNENSIKSRSISFVDHLGNLTSEEYIDHEHIETITMNYKQNHVPKYLHQWTKFGMMKDNSIFPLTDLQLKSTVSNFKNGQELFSCGVLIVWIGTFEESSLRKIVVPVFISDTMEKVKVEIKKQRQFNEIELKLSVIDDNDKPTGKNWSEGTPLPTDETIFSLQLFQKNHVILAKVMNEDDCSNTVKEFVENQKRLSLHSLPDRTIQTIENVLALNFHGIEHSSSQLQESIL
jgi:hypothetical protein